MSASPTPSGHIGTAAAKPQHPRIAVPRPLRWLVPIVVVYVLLLLALPVQMTVGQEALGDTIMRQRPSLDPAHRQFAVAISLVYTWGIHGIGAVLVSWLTVKTLRGRQWARTVFSLYLLIALPASLVSAAVGGLYIYYVIPSDVIHFIILLLLWLPASVRQFFVQHRAAKLRKKSTDVATPQN